MRYPSFAEYTDALQLDLGIALADPLLARGTLGTYGPGLPIARGGTFALTFEVVADGRRYALRCFLREIDSLQVRYAAISRLLARIGSPHFVDFEFQPLGITTWSGTYPIVRMDWADGENLAQFVAARRDDMVALRRVQAALRELATHLRAHDIAHGDLQPGNIIVRQDGSLQLVDYDGLFVPQLGRLRSADLGQRNFRHPGRRARHFGPALDAFPFAVLDFALEALCRQPDLWDRTGSGEDAFMLRAADYVDPANSATFAMLAQVPGLELRTRHLAAICVSPFHRIPAFEDFLAGRAIPAARVDFARNPLAVERPPYLSRHAVVEASDFARCCNHVGDRIELVGRIVRIERSAMRHYGAPGLRVEFGERAHDMCCLRITPDACARLDEIPDQRWIGEWVSAVGLLEPVATGMDDARRQKSVSITITDRSQLRRLTEGEAQYRLGDQGGRTDLAPETAAGVATDPIYVAVPRSHQQSLLRPLPPARTQPLPEPQSPVLPQPAPAVPTRSGADASLRFESPPRSQAPPAVTEARPPAPRPAGAPRGPRTSATRLDGSYWLRWILGIAVLALAVGFLLLERKAAEPEALPPKVSVAVDQPPPVTPQTPQDELPPVPADVAVTLVAQRSLAAVPLPIETTSGPVTIAAARSEAATSVVLLGGAEVPGLRDDAIALVHHAEFSDREVIVGFTTCRGDAPPCGSRQPFWLMLRSGMPATVRQVPGLWAGNAAVAVTATSDGVQVDLGPWNGERRVATLTTAGNIVVAREALPAARLGRADCAIVARSLEACAASRDCSTFARTAQRIPASQWTRLTRMYHETTGLDAAAFRNLCMTSCRLGLTPSQSLIRRQACSGAPRDQWSTGDPAAGLSRLGS